MPPEWEKMQWLEIVNCSNASDSFAGICTRQPFKYNLETTVSFQITSMRHTPDVLNYCGSAMNHGRLFLRMKTMNDETSRRIVIDAAKQSISIGHPCRFFSLNGTIWECYRAEYIPDIGGRAWFAEPIAVQIISDCNRQRNNEGERND